IQAWEIEEGYGIAMADIEKEVGRPLVITVLKDISQGKFEETLVKLDGPLHVGAEQRHMVHPARRGRRTISVGMHIGRTEPSAFGCQSGEITCLHDMLLAD